MESTRDIRRMMEREIRKGSPPLLFDRLEYPQDAVREIDSQEKLEEVLSYLLRRGEYEKLANDMTRNNVYLENHLISGDKFCRRNNVLERNANYMNIMAYATRRKPIYEHKTFVESVTCCFSFPTERLEKYRFVYEGVETFAFPLSNRYIVNGLFLMCNLHRRELAFGDAPDFIETPEHRDIYHLTENEIRAVLFQCLLLDDMHLGDDGLFRANLHTIYLLQ